MIRMFLIMAAAGLVGWLGARYEAGGAFDGAKERFSSSRETYAERQGRITKEEILQAEGTPKVEIVGGTNFDFGTMQHGETRSHEFVVRNIGTGPLHLEMGDTTCKCTIGDLEESVLEPGEETQIRLSWTAQSLIREFGQTAKIITTDPEKTEVKLTVRGQVVDSFVLEPGELAFGDFLGTDGISKTIYVVNYFEEDVALEDLHWTDKTTVPLVEIKHEKLPMDLEKFPQHPEAKGLFKIDVSVQPGMPLGQVKGRLRFSTSLGEAVGMIDVPVRGRATGDVSLLGGSSFDPMLNMVKFGTISSKKGSKITIFMRVSQELASRGKPKIVSVSPEGSLTASIGEGKESGDSVIFPISLEIPKGAELVNLSGPKADQYGQLILKTEGASGGEIPIYCRMIVVD